MTRTRLALPVLLLAALVLGLVRTGGSAFGKVASLNHQTSDTSYRTAVADGVGAVLRGSGIVLRHRLACSPLNRVRAADAMTCHGITSDGLPVVVSGRVGSTDGPDQRQEYLVTVDGRRLWQGTCLGPSCRFP